MKRGLGMEVKLKKSKPLRIAYVKHTGVYDKIPYDQYYRELFAWAKGQRLRPAGPPVGIFYDDPKTVPAKKCRSELGISIRGRAKPERKIKIKEIPSTDVAAITHRGPMKDYPKTYEKLNRWIAENGYVCTGPTMEIYLSKPKLVRGEPSIFSVIQVPVKKAQIAANNTFDFSRCASFFGLWRGTRGLNSRKVLNMRLQFIRLYKEKEVGWR